MWSYCGDVALDANGTNLFGTFRFRDLAENQAMARSLSDITWIYGNTYGISNGFSSC